MGGDPIEVLTLMIKAKFPYSDILSLFAAQRVSVSTGTK
jgi:hypothetical protein